jgi:hypothetical protein
MGIYNALTRAVEEVIETGEALVEALATKTD